MVTVERQAVIVAVRVVNTVEVVISRVGVSAGEVIVGSTVDSEDAGAPGVETEDSMSLLEAGLTGPMIMVVKVIGPTVLLGDSENMSDGDPDPSELEWPDGVLIGTETLVEVDEPHLFSNEM